jgi:hypothetical protein
MPTPSLGSHSTFQRGQFKSMGLVYATSDCYEFGNGMCNCHRGHSDQSTETSKRRK